MYGSTRMHGMIRYYMLYNERKSGNHAGESEWLLRYSGKGQICYIGVGIN